MKCVVGRARKKVSKFDCDPFLFKPEPPINARHVKGLFVGRERELARGLETLKRALDVNGSRSKQYDKRPWVIHGESRSGKSHLARRILIDLPKDKQKKIQLVIPARGRMEALLVMRHLFELLQNEFSWRINDQTRTIPDELRPQVNLVADLINKMAMFFGGGAEKAVITLEESTQKAFEAGIESGAVTPLLKFMAKFTSGRSQTQTQELTLRDPTPRDLAELCRIIAETLIDCKLVNHVLVLVDDVDLLEGYVNVQQNGRIQRSLLSEALIDFHGTPGVDVVLTSRSWYAHAQKEFQTLVDLAQSPPMIADELIGIHDCRDKVFGVQGAPCRFLSTETLHHVADDAQRLPGVFLQHLDTAYQAYQNEEEWGERDHAWYVEVFRQRFDQFRAICPEAVRALEQAVKKGQLTLNVAERNPFFGTVLEDEFVYQSYYNETSYYMSKLVHKLLLPEPLPPALQDLP